MSEYLNVKGGKLKFKGMKNRSSKKHKKGAKRENQEEKSDDDALKHGGWWVVRSFTDITGPIAIETFDHVYLKALDNGNFVLGSSHSPGEGPSPEEIITAVPISESSIALKSGYGKYLSVNNDGFIVGRSDAIGSREQWEPVFEDNKLALLNFNQCFLSYSEDNEIKAINVKAGKDSMIKVRSIAELDTKPTDSIPDLDKKNLKDCELGYVKQFQSFQNKRVLVNPEDRAKLKKARTDGSLHEGLLDRREKMKADRYCK